MNCIGGTAKNVVFPKVKSGMVTIHPPFGFYQAVVKFVLTIKFLYLVVKDILEKPENVVQESKLVPQTLRIHKAKRCEVKGVYHIKFFHFAEDETSV